MNLWVYKVRNDPDTEFNAWGDWLTKRSFRRRSYVAARLTKASRRFAGVATPAYVGRLDRVSSAARTRRFHRRPGMRTPRPKPRTP